MNYTKINHESQLVNGMLIEGLRFNSGTDYRNVFDNAESNCIDTYFDDYYLQENAIIVTDSNRQLINDTIMELCNFTVDDFDYDLTDDYGINVAFYWANANNPAGTLAQSDAFNSDIAIMDASKFIEGLNEFIARAKTNPKYRIGNSNFNSYAMYKDVEFIYNLDNCEPEYSDYIDSYIERIGKYVLENEFIEFITTVEQSIHLTNSDDIIAKLKTL